MNDNRTIIRNYFATMSGQGDTPVTEFLAADITWTLPPAHPMGGPFEGIDAVLAMLEKGGHLFRFETIEMDMHSLAADGDDVFAHFGLQALMHDGRRYANEYVFRFRLRDGKIAAVWEFLDTYRQYEMGMWD